MRISEKKTKRDSVLDILNTVVECARDSTLMDATYYADKIDKIY